jgi:hypothetical protein
MESNEGGESSKELSSPIILPLTSLRISEGNRSSLTGHWLLARTFLGLPARPFGPRPKLLRGTFFPLTICPHSCSQLPNNNGGLVPVALGLLPSKKA